jgi:hypothetical protein
MTRARLLPLMMTAILLWPSPAHAARGFWGWLEELSGPGPFKGGGYVQPVACVDPKTHRLKWCWRTLDEDKVPQTLMVSVGVFNSGDGPRFNDLSETDADNQGNVRLWSVSGLYVFRVGAFEIGPGAGLVRLSGAGFDPFYKLVLTPINASFAPLALKWKTRRARALRLELDSSFIAQGFTGADFNNSRTSFDSGPEFITRGTLVVDFGALIR